MYHYLNVHQHFFHRTLPNPPTGAVCITCVTPSPAKKDVQIVPITPLLFGKQWIRAPFNFSTLKFFFLATEEDWRIQNKQEVIFVVDKSTCSCGKHGTCDHILNAFVLIDLLQVIFKGSLYLVPFLADCALQSDCTVVLLQCVAAPQVPRALRCNCKA